MIKYCVKEYTPKTQNQGTHSWYPEVVIGTEITNVDLAKKIAARTGMKAYEAQMAIAAMADIINEESLEGSRITLATERGVKVVSFQPKVSGGVSDTDIERITTAQHAEDPSVPIRTVAEESDVTPSRMTWTISATVGVKFSKQFAFEKEAKKVSSTGVASEQTVVNDDNHSGVDTSTGGDDLPPGNG